MDMIFFLASIVFLIAFVISFIVRLIRRKPQKPTSVFGVLALVFFIGFIASPTTLQPERSDPAQIIYEDTIVKVEYERTTESVGIEGFYLGLSVYNKSNREIWVYLDNCSVNNEMIPLVMSGTPMVIPSGKTSNNPFILPAGNISAKKIEDVKRIEFDINVLDNQTNEILVSTNPRRIDL